MAKLIHTMIRVRDLGRSIDFYKTALKFEETHRLDFPSFTLVYLGNRESQAEIELTFNKDKKEPYVHGDAYGHVAFAVPDLLQAHADMTEAGYRPAAIKQLSRDGAALAEFFFIEDPDGYKIEVLQSAGHYQ